MRHRIAFCLISLALAHGLAHGHGGHGGNHIYDADRTPFGEPGDPKRVVRTIAIEMSDVRCTRPAEIRLRRGETLRFAVTNHGTQIHELILGTSHELAEHAAEFTKGQDADHDQSFALHVDPGATGTIVWRFTRVGIFGFDCLIRGLNESKMAGRIVVTR